VQIRDRERVAAAQAGQHSASQRVMDSSQTDSAAGCVVGLILALQGGAATRHRWRSGAGLCARAPARYGRADARQQPRSNPAHSRSTVLHEDHLSSAPIVQLSGTESRPPSGRRFDGFASPDTAPTRKDPAPVRKTGQSRTPQPGRCHIAHSSVTMIPRPRLGTRSRSWAGWIR
jgi:hypothetical protein